MLPVHPKFSLLDHSQLLLNSYRRWRGRDLIDPGGSLQVQAERLFSAPFVVVSHGTEADPILNYGNQCALRLWELEWEEFITIPSRLTADPMGREERVRFMAQVTEQGFIENYGGIRISKTGRRFRIENAVVWNLIDEQGAYCGQAATFVDWDLFQS